MSYNSCSFWKTLNIVMELDTHTSHKEFIGQEKCLFPTNSALRTHHTWNISSVPGAPVRKGIDEREWAQHGTMKVIKGLEDVA